MGKKEEKSQKNGEKIKKFYTLPAKRFI